MDDLGKPHDLRNLHMIVYIYMSVWRLPKMGLPLNHLFDFWIFHELNRPCYTILGYCRYPHLWKPLCNPHI